MARRLPFEGLTIKTLRLRRAALVVVGLVNFPQVLHKLIDSRIGSSDAGRAQGGQELSHRQQTRRLVREHVEQNVLDILLVDFALTKQRDQKKALRTARDNDDFRLTRKIFVY